MGRASALALLLLSTHAWTADTERAVAFNETGIRHLLSSRPDAAVTDFEEALKLRPESRVLQRNLAAALSLRGRAHSEAKRLSQALVDFERAVELHPERLRYRHLRGETRLGLGGDGNRLYAREDFQWVLERDPDYYPTLIYLASMDYADRRLQSCVQLYDRALVLQADNPKVQAARDKAARELAVEERYETVRDRNFVVRYSPDIPRDVAEAVLGFCDDAYVKLTRELDTVPHKVTVVTLYPRGDFRSATRAHGWVGGLYDGTIRISMPGRRNPESVRGTLTHEFCHLLVHGITPRVPRWLDEGLAERAEGESVAASRARLSRQARPKLAELDGHALRGSDRASARRFYDLALAFTHFLHERGGERGMLDLLRALGSGRQPEAAVEAVYGRTLAQVFEAFAATLAEG